MTARRGDGEGGAVKLAFFKDPAVRPVGRLCNWDLQVYENRLYYSFTAPSRSHPTGAYEILVDAVTLETDCDCIWHRMRRGTRAGIAQYGPINLLHPRHLCHHLNRISAWVRKNKKGIKAYRVAAIEANRLMSQQSV